MIVLVALVFLLMRWLKLLIISAVCLIPLSLHIFDFPHANQFFEHSQRLGMIVRDANIRCLSFTPPPYLWLVIDAV